MNVTTWRSILASALVVLAAGAVSLTVSQAQQRPIAVPAILTAHSAAEATFSNMDLRGDYGYSFTGQILEGPVAGPLAGVGWASYDGAGNVSVTETATLNGTVVQRTGTGTYQMNSNGTGTASITFTTVDPPGIPDSVSTLAFVISNNRLSIDMVVTNPGVVVPIVARKVVSP